MRGSDGMQEELFTVASSKTSWLPITRCARSGCWSTKLGRLNGLFNLIYADSGRATIAPEKLLRAMLVQELFSVTSSP